MSKIFFPTQALRNAWIEGKHDMRYLQITGKEDNLLMLLTSQFILTTAKRDTSLKMF